VELQELLQYHSSPLDNKYLVKRLEPLPGRKKIRHW